MMADAVIRSAIFDLREVSFAYRGVQALTDFSLQVKRGERVALIGANGSGKSTLLRLLGGLLFPQQGYVSFGGEDLTEAKLREEGFFYRFRRSVGILFQNPDIQLFNASVFEEVAFGPLQLRWPRSEIRNQVEKTLNEMGIADLRDRASHRLSDGEKKRVALASILILDPEVLLLDEPTATLDPRSNSQIIDLLSSWGQGDKTVITATHDLDSVSEIADRCYVLDGGRLAGAGTPLEILHDVRLLTSVSLLRPQHHAHKHHEHKQGGQGGPGQDLQTTHPHIHLEDVE